MTTITVVVNKEKKPQYKDYVNFLDNYKNSKKDESDDNSVGYSLSSSSLSSIDIETDLPTKSFNEYMQNYSTKKYQPVQPKLQTKQKNVKTEVFIQINNNEDQESYSPKRVDEIAKVFNNKTKNVVNNNNHNLPPLPKGTNIKITPKSPLSTRSPMSIGRETINTPPMSPVLAALTRKFSSETITIPPKSPVFNTQQRKVMNLNGNLSPKPFIPITKTTPPVNEVPTISKSEIPSPPRLPMEISTTKLEIPSPPPPPPPLPMMPSIPVKPNVNYSSKSSTLPRMTNNNHHIQSDAVDSSTLSKNDPRVKKAVYGALRNMYGAYHDKANDYLSTLPKNRVKKGNGLDSIINSIAAQGGLEKLSGRAKVEAD